LRTGWLWNSRRTGATALAGYARLHAHRGDPRRASASRRRRGATRSSIPKAKGFGWAGSETPCFIGRGVAALAADPGVVAKGGGLFGSWALADEYGFTDYRRRAAALGPIRADAFSAYLSRAVADAVRVASGTGRRARRSCGRRCAGGGAMKPLDGQVALVAGATRGAGRGIARALGEAGALVYCTGRSTRGNPSPYARPETIEETGRD
jgi:hypothetical protein